MATANMNKILTAEEIINPDLDMPSTDGKGQGSNAMQTEVSQTDRKDKSSMAGMGSNTMLTEVNSSGRMILFVQEQLEGLI